MAPTFLYNELRDSAVDDAGATVGDALAGLTHRRSVVLSYSWRDMRTLTRAQTPNTFRSCRLATRSNYRGLILYNPMTDIIARWRRDEGVARCTRRAERDAAEREKSYDDIVLAMPPARSASSRGATAKRRGGQVAKEIDPLNIINAVGFPVFYETPATFPMRWLPGDATTIPIATSSRGMGRKTRSDPRWRIRIENWT